MRDSFSHLYSLPTARPRCQVSPAVEGTHSGDNPLTPFNGWGTEDGITWELIRNLGILVHLSPPGWAYLQQTSFIGRIFLSLHTWGRRDISSIQGSQSEHWRLDGVRIWKLNRTYSGKKQPSLSVPTQVWCLVTSKHTRHLLAIPNIPVGMGALY